MIILWITKRNGLKLDTPKPGKSQSFPEHDASMKKFRQTHPKKASSPARDILMPEGNLLAPIASVKLHENIQN